jgi:hypothetical protein
MATTYATVEEMRDYAEDILRTHELSEDDAVVERLLLRAERDVDLAIGGEPHPATARRLDPSKLTDPQTEALMRATCAAAVFRVRQRESNLVGSDDGVSTAGSVTFARSNTLPRRSPVMIEELEGFALLAPPRTVTPQEDAQPEEA